MKLKHIGIAIFSTIFLAGCSKLANVAAPPTSINDANVYDNNTTASAVLTGIYTNIVNDGFTNSNTPISISFYAGMSADEFTLFGGNTNSNYTDFYTNGLNSSTISPDFWSGIYSQIFVANAAIAGLQQSSGLTPSVGQQALGEAYFIRAFFYYYLVNLYGDVPLVLTTNYQANSEIVRTPRSAVLTQIVSDLQTAKNLLSVNYLDGSLLNTVSQRIRPTKWAAEALLARTYLCTGGWTDAVNQADSVIGNTSMFSLPSLQNAFLLTSSEAIWQLQPVQEGWNTLDAQTFIIPSSGPASNWPVYLSSNLMNSFEAGDQRRANWVDSVIAGGITYYYPFKYESDQENAQVTEFEMVLRLGEQYLIRAEAEAQLGNMNGTPGAISDLNVIRTRAGLANYVGATDKASVLTAILHERQVELFSEWGHRWFDLKRMGTVNAVMGGSSGVCASKGGSWVATDTLYPIQASQLQLDTKLVQNPGYN